jgi:hypothetical protein
MIAHPDHINAGALHARAVLAVAAEVEAAEAAIKQAILDAARAGDCARVIDLVARWQTTPPGEVLAAKLSGDPLDSMRGSEVIQP